MIEARARHVLSEAVWADGSAGWVRRVALVALGVAALAVAAKLKLPFWPVPLTMQTMVVLMIGAAYGSGLGAATLLAYLALGALGADVFTGADSGGLAYMMGATGGYLLGFLLAVLLTGALARRGWDRTALGTLGAMALGLLLIFVPGVLWLGVLFAAEKGWTWVLSQGAIVFLPAEALKLALAALLLPAAWRLVGEPRA
ncbi:MAG: biotin transporter BioY [Pikeienuella sp.]